MASVGLLLNEVGKLVNDTSDVLARGRYLRDGKILPKSKRRKTPFEVDTVHAVSLLLAVLKAGPQLDSAQAVIELWHMPGAGVLSTDPKKPSTPFPDKLTFGQHVARLVDTFAASDTWGKMSFSQVFSRIEVMRSFPSASIVFPNGTIYHFEVPADSFSWQNTLQNAIKTVTFCDVTSVQTLGSLVIHSRQAAARLGVSIPTADAYEAIGLSPPENDDLPVTSQKKTAVFLAGKTAVIKDQAAETAMALASHIEQHDGSPSRDSEQSLLTALGRPAPSRSDRDARSSSDDAGRKSRPARLKAKVV